MIKVVLHELFPRNNDQSTEWSNLKRTPGGRGGGGEWNIILWRHVNLGVGIWYNKVATQ